MIKKYSYDVVEEMVMNEKYSGYAGGRIEIWDIESKEPYPIAEGRFLIPLEYFADFREWVENIKTDLPLYISIDKPLR